MMQVLLLDAASVFRSIGYVIVALLTLMVMIVIHEAGHYSVGKLLKFKINEFAIGFGPPIWKHTKKNGEVFSIRPIPLGGFCAFEGEDGEEEGQSEGAFCAQAPWKRILVLLAGVTFNFLSGIIIMTICFCAYGYTLPQVTGTNPPQDAALVQNLQEGDILYQVNGQNVYSLTGFNIGKILEKVDGDTVEVVVYRDGKKVTVTTGVGYWLSTDEEGVTTAYYGLGILTQATGQYVGFFQSLWRAIVFSGQIVALLFQTIGGLFTGLVSLKGSIGGPITTIGVIADSVAISGFRGELYLMGMLSANLAIMNILPLPALDGSRIVFTLIEWIFRKPVNRKVEAIIHTVGMVLLFGMTIVFDILNLV